MFAVGVVPVVIVCAPAYAWRWGIGFAMAHSFVLFASGAFLLELLLWNYEQMPCARPWRPERANLGKRWPLYLAGFVAFSTWIPAVEVRLVQRPSLMAAFIALIALAALAVRIAHRRRLVLPPDDFDALGAPAVLGLS
jgi:hypothetical protein